MKQWLVVGSLAALAPLAAQAQSRWVFVNGQRMSDAQVLRLMQLQCAAIPDGRYWLNTRSGAWGYEGLPVVQGHLGDACRAAAPRPGLSQRGQLYRPGEILNGR